MADEKVVQDTMTALSASERIRVLSEELQRVMKDNHRWSIEVTASVEQVNGDFCIIVRAMMGDHLVSQAIDSAQVEHWSVDVETLANLLASQFATELVKNEIKDDLLPKLVRAVNNIKTLKKSSL